MSRAKNRVSTSTGDEATKASEKIVSKKRASSEVLDGSLEEGIALQTDSSEPTTTEQAILAAAEQEFLSKGFAGTKTVEIAKRAGVNHAMIHYYFRTKEALFNLVFQEKIEQIAGSISASFGIDLPFVERVELAITTHFDFVARDPKLMFFLYNEVITNDRRRRMLIKRLYPKILLILEEMQRGIDVAVQRGEIRQISAIELLLNVVSLNVITFLAKPLFEMIDEPRFNALLEGRKHNNIEFIISALRI